MNIDELRDYNKIILRLGLEKHSKSVRLSSLGVEGWSIEDHHSISDITTIIEQADKIAVLEANQWADAITLIKNHEITKFGGSVKDALYVLEENTEENYHE